MQSAPPTSAHGSFAPTRWTLVLRARGETPEARAALSDLCAACYQPVFRFLRREGRTEDTARELAQEFFARVLAGRGFAGAEPAQGRFRSFLLGAVKHFLADVRDREQRQKRGGGVAPESLDALPGDTTGTAPGLQVPDPGTPPTDAWFDRQWALAVMDRALQALEAEMNTDGKRLHFDLLKPWLAGEGAGTSQATVARQLGLSEGAVKVAVHRLRRRFRQLIRTEIAHTLSAGADVDTELRYLVEVLSSSSWGRSVSLDSAS